MAIFNNFTHQVAPQKNTKIFFFKPSKLNRKAPSAYNGLPLASTMNHPFDESKHNSNGPLQELLLGPYNFF